LFASGSAANMPSYELEEEDFTEESVDILTLLHVSGLVPSKSEARRAVQQGGVSVDGEKIADIKTAFTKEQFADDGLVIKRGKKNFRRVFVK
jgi:tyrosyl-tRNA synthetase